MAQIQGLHSFSLSELECDCASLISPTVKWLVSAALGCGVLGDLGLACVVSLALHVCRTGLKR